MVAAATTAENMVTITAPSVRCSVAANKEAAEGLREGGPNRRGGESYQPSQLEPPEASCRRSCAPSTSPVIVDSCGERGVTSAPICAPPLSSGRRKPLATASQPRISHRRVGPMPVLDTLDTLLLRARQPCSRGRGVLAAREMAPASKRPRRSKGLKLVLERSANEEARDSSAVGPYVAMAPVEFASKAWTAVSSSALLVKT